MTDENPQESHEPLDLKEELRRLGENLRQTITAAWESQERQEIQQDLEDGLNEAANSLRTMAHEFDQSPTGQQMKSDLHDLNERMQSGELQSKVRKDIFSALRKANEEIEKTFFTKEEK